MRIVRPVSLEEAVGIRKSEPSSAYLSGGTAVLSLISGLADDALLIDITGLLANESTRNDGCSVVSAMATLDAVASDESVPEAVREAAMFCPSLQIRAQATIGGNIALGRFDSYLIPSLYVSSAALSVVTEEGRKKLPVDEYLRSDDKSIIITEISFPMLSSGGESVRIGRSSHSHAALIAARCGDRHAYGVSGSGFAFGGRDSWKDIQYNDDLTGSAAYKRYMASVVFKEGR